MSRSLVKPHTQEVLPATNTLDLAATEYSVVQAWIWPYVLFGGTVILSLIGGFCAWALTAKLDGAVIATAEFSVESKRKTVQHLEGGIVDRILVKEGDRVSAGQVLVRLDSTIDRTRYEVLENEMRELTAQRTRLLAELHDKSKLSFPKPTSLESGDSKRVDIILGQQQLFEARQKSRNNEMSIRTKRKRALADEISGIERQIKSNNKQIAFVDDELSGLRTLRKRGLVQRRRLLILEREAERIRGQSAALSVNIARARNSQEQIELEGARASSQFKEAVTTDLRIIEPKIIQLTKEWAAAKEKLARVDIRSPATGYVVALKVHTRGGVIRPGDDITDIVPENEKLILEAKLSTSDIDKIKMGQSARVQLSAFDQSVTPEANAEVLSVSADRLKDDRTGENYFLARLALSADQPAPVAELSFVPGMPATVFIQTGKRTPFSYLLQPLRTRLTYVFADG